MLEGYGMILFPNKDGNIDVCLPITTYMLELKGLLQTTNLNY